MHTPRYTDNTTAGAFSSIIAKIVINYVLKAENISTDDGDDEAVDARTPTNLLDPAANLELAHVGL